MHLARVAVAASILLLVASCSSGSFTTPPLSTPTAGPSPSATVPTTSPATSAVPEPVNVQITMSVNTVAGDFGGYIVNLHDGNPAKQTTFTVGKSGKWSKTITVPNESFVKLDIARTGATCTIALAETGQVLITDENSCIVGS